MPATAFRLKRKPRVGGKAIQSVYNEQIVKRLTPIGQEHVSLREHEVSDWSDRTRPKFGFRIVAGPKIISIIVKITNPGQNIRKGSAMTVLKLWQKLDWTGLPIRYIVPRNKTWLRFRPIGSNRFRFAKKVRHPGTSPRLRSVFINIKLEPKTRKAINNAYRAAWRRIN